LPVAMAVCGGGGDGDDCPALRLRSLKKTRNLWVVSNALQRTTGSLGHGTATGANRHRVGIGLHTRAIRPNHA
jgi:hypothetical protein